MSKKVVVIHAEHVFGGYKSDYDYEGNAQFYEELYMVAYVQKDKARKLVRAYGSKVGMTRYSYDGLNATKKAQNPSYTSEHEYIETMTPAEFLFRYGSLGHGFDQALSMMGQVGKKDLERYMDEVQVMCNEYDPF